MDNYLYRFAWSGSIVHTEDEIEFTNNYDGFISVFGNDAVAARKTAHTYLIENCGMQSLAIVPSVYIPTAQKFPNLFIVGFTSDWQWVDEWEN